MFRRALAALAALAAVVALPAQAQAPAWPRGQVRMLVTYPPGGTSDFVARFLAQHLQQQTGQPFVVENRSGGGGVVGWTAAVRAPADGTTFLLTDNSLATAPPLYPNLGFDILADFTPVSLLVDYPTVFVVPGDSPARSLRDFVDTARARGQEAGFFGSMGAGSSPHLYMEYLQDAANFRLTHVPYRGMGPAFADLLAGRGLDPAIIARMQQEVARFLANPEVQERFRQQGATPVGGDGAALRRVMEGELARWSEVIRVKGITLQN